MTPEHVFRRITRRSFIAKTSIAAGMGCAAPGLLAGPGGSSDGLFPSTYQVGCYTRPFDQFDYRVAMDAIAEAGFNFVGIMTTNTKGWVMIRTTTPTEEVEAIHQEARKRKLKVLSVYGDFPADNSVEVAIAGLRRLIDHCATCDCPNLLLGGTAEEKLYAVYYKAIAESCDYAAEKKVGLSIKPHGGLNATGPQCRKAIEQVGHRNFRLWYDPGNIFYYSDGKLDPVEDSKTVDGLVVGMSVKDFAPPKEVLVNPGAGKVDFASVMANLKKGGFSGGPLILECLQRGEMEAVKRAARKARQFIESFSAK